MQKTKGFALIELVLTLLAVGAVMFYLAKNYSPQAMNASLQEKLKSQGVELPEGMKLDEAAKTAEAIRKQLNEAQQKSADRIKCAAEGGDSCSQ